MQNSTNKTNQKAYNTQYRLHNKAKIATYNKQWRLKNKIKPVAREKHYNIDKKTKRAAYMKQYKLDNKTKIAAYLVSNKAKIAEQQKQYRLNNKVKIDAYEKQYRSVNKDIRKAKYDAYSKQYKLNNKVKMKEYSKQYIKQRCKIDLIFKSKYVLRSAVYHAFKRIGENKPARTEQLLGCSWLEAKSHFERLFQEGMSWENHGEWHIDHVRPVASFKADELHLMNHINNLQPLWAEENLGSKKVSDTVKWLLNTNSNH